MISVDWLLSFFICIGILGLWWVSRRLQGSWFSPGGIMCGIWFFGALLPLMVTRYFPSMPSSYLLISLFVVVGVVASSLPMITASAPKEGIRWTKEDCLWLNRIYWVCLLVGCASPILLYKLVAGMFGSSDFLVLASDVTVARYTGEFNAPILITILNMILYVSALLGGFLLGVQTDLQWSKKAQYLLWIGPLGIVMAVQTTKASLLFAVILCASALVSGKILSGGEKSIRFGRLITILTALCAVAFLFIMVMQLTRWGSYDMAKAAESVPNVTGTFLGHMSVLGEWMAEGGIDHPAMSVGTYTFGGISEMLGFSERKMGLYEGSVYFPNGFSSNIYTAFRSLIEDFSLTGALLFFAIFSFLAGWCWLSLLQRRIWAAAMYIVYVAYVMLSPITSVFVYNTNVGALGLFAVLVICLKTQIHRIPLRERMPHAEPG